MACPTTTPNPLEIVCQDPGGTTSELAARSKRGGDRKEDTSTTNSSSLCKPYTAVAFQVENSVALGPHSEVLGPHGETKREKGNLYSLEEDIQQVRLLSHGVSGTSSLKRGTTPGQTGENTD